MLGSGHFGHFEIVWICGNLQANMASFIASFIKGYFMSQQFLVYVELILKVLGKF